MRNKNLIFIVLIYLTVLLFPGLSLSDQVGGAKVGGSAVSGKPVSGQPPFGSFFLDEEKFRNCLEKKKKRLEKIANEEVLNEIAKEALVDQIITTFSGGSVTKYSIGHVIKKKVSGVVPESWEHIGEEISEVLSYCAKKSEEKKSDKDTQKKVGLNLEVKR